MTLSIDDFRQALDIVGDNADAEVAIVAQFALDLAVTAQFHSEGGGLDAEDVRRLLQLSPISARVFAAVRKRLLTTSWA